MIVEFLNNETIETIDIYSISERRMFHCIPQRYACTKLSDKKYLIDLRYNILYEYNKNESGIRIIVYSDKEPTIKDLLNKQLEFNYSRNLAAISNSSNSDFHIEILDIIHGLDFPFFLVD